HRAGGLSDRHLHLAPGVQEVRRSEDQGRAQGGRPVRADRRAEVQRGARVHSASVQRRHGGHEGARTDPLMGHPEKIDSTTRWEMDARNAGTDGESISRPPSAGEIWVDRIFRSGTRLVAWAAVALVFYVVWDIARAAFPAMQGYGVGFLAGQTWDANKHEF